MFTRTASNFYSQSKFRNKSSFKLEAVDLCGYVFTADTKEENRLSSVSVCSTCNKSCLTLQERAVNPHLYGCIRRGDKTANVKPTK